MSEVNEWPPTKKIQGWGQEKPDGKYLVEKMIEFKDQRDKGGIPHNDAPAKDLKYNGTDKSPVDYRAGRDTSSKYIYEVFRTHENLRKYTTKQMYNAFRNCAERVLKDEQVSGKRKSQGQRLLENDNPRADQNENYNSIMHQLDLEPHSSTGKELKKSTVKQVGFKDIADGGESGYGTTDDEDMTCGICTDDEDLPENPPISSYVTPMKILPKKSAFLSPKMKSPAKPSFTSPTYYEDAMESESEIENLITGVSSTSLDPSVVCDVKYKYYIVDWKEKKGATFLPRVSIVLHLPSGVRRRNINVKVHQTANILTYTEKYNDLFKNAEFLVDAFPGSEHNDAMNTAVGELLREQNQIVHDGEVEKIKCKMILDLPFECDEKPVQVKIGAEISDVDLFRFRAKDPDLKKKKQFYLLCYIELQGRHKHAVHESGIVSA